MSNSVGKISLDLEVQSDINKQIGEVSSLIGQNLKNSLDSGMKAALNGLNSTTKNQMNQLNQTMTQSVDALGRKIKTSLNSTLSALRKLKMPSMKFSSPTDIQKSSLFEPTQQNVRGPPNLNTEAIRAQIETLGKTLDNTNARIEQQQEKLKLLREQYSATFNQNRKNQLQEKMLKTESVINRLTATSDKLGFKLADLDAQLIQTSNASNHVNKGFNLMNQSAKKATDSSVKLASRLKNNQTLLSSYQRSISMVAKSILTWGIIFPMIMRGLSALATYIGQSLMTNEQFSNSLAQIKTNLMVAFTPIMQAILPALNALMSALATATTYIASFISALFGKTYQQSYQATQGLIAAKEAMGAYGDTAKSTGKAVEAALGLASFDEINSLNSSKGSGGSGGTGGVSSAPQLVTPSLDTSTVDSAMKKLVDRIKGYINSFNFKPLLESFDRLKTSIEPIINNVGKVIKWFLVEILDPLAHWAISDLIPAFLNLLAGALDVINPILEVFIDLGKWLWEEFLQPIAAWTGGVIVDVLNGLADVLSAIGDWLSEHKPIVEAFAIVLGSLALAWGLVSGALAIASAVSAIWSGVSYAASVATTAFGLAISFLTSPITLAILAIGAIIAIGILLYKNWDFIKEKAIEIWNNIQTTISQTWTSVKSKTSEAWNYVKEKFNQFKTWLGNVFATDWSKRFGAFGDILNGFLKNVKNIFDSVKRVFSGIIDFVAGVFTGDWKRAWQGLVDIFGGIMNGLGAVIKAPLNAVISLINAAIGSLNKISVDIPDWVPGVGGQKFGVNIPKIPMLARGGMIGSPTLAMIGEAGYNEAVVPLDRDAKALSMIADILTEKMGSQSQQMQAGNDQPINITVQVGSTTLGKLAIEGINKVQRQAGTTLIKKI